MQSEERFGSSRSFYWVGWGIETTDTRFDWFDFYLKLLFILSLLFCLVKLALRGLSSNTFDIDVGAKKGRKNNKMDVNGFRFELIPKEVFLDDNESWSRSWIKDFAVEDDVTYLISPLSANTTYLVRVAARNIAGFSDWRTEEFQTDVNSKQSNVTSGSSRVPFSILLVVLCGIIYRQISLP